MAYKGITSTHTYACRFRSFAASNDAEFRNQVLSAKPDLIILDLVLGEQDGRQIYYQLLEEGLDRTIPVVFLSALAYDRPPSLPQKDRRFSLLGKPFDPVELISLLRARLGDSANSS